MPDEIAIQVLRKHLGAAWVANPTGRYVQGAIQLCGENGRGNLPPKEITAVRQFENPSRLLLEKSDWRAFPCSMLAHEVMGQFGRNDVDDIVDALVSLGAKIDEVKR
jgi:hypothetical protein